MISRSTLVGALVVVELAIVGMAAKAIAGDAGAPSIQPFGFGHHHIGLFGRDGAPVTKPLDKTFRSGVAPHVVIDVHDVDVYVSTSPETGVHVVETVQTSGYVSGTFAALTAEPIADGLRIGSSGGSSVHVMIGSVDRALRLIVPAAAQVEIVSGGRVEVSGLRAKFIAHVEDGAIHVTNQRGDVDVSTGDGRIYLTDVQSADIAATTHSGRLYFTRVGAERLDAHTNCGRIYATDIRAVDGALTTKDGRVSVSLAGNSDATVTAKIQDSDDKITVSGLSATDEGTNTRTVRLGSGRGHFEIGSDNGSVNITQGANL